MKIPFGRVIIIQRGNVTYLKVLVKTLAINPVDILKVNIKPLV